MTMLPEDLFGGESLPAAAAAIGAFDGLHLGHRHILRNTAAYAQREGIDSAAVLFDPLPSQFFGRLGPNQRILLPDEQLEMIASLGITHTVILPFSQKIADLSPKEFLLAMQDRLHCKRLFMGEDFSIGKGRSGDPSVISELGGTLGFTTEVIPKDVMDGTVISSTGIRALLLSGKTEEANLRLGYPFFYSSPIIHGAARGRKIGFPTINTRIPEGKIKLPNGVYAVAASVDRKKYAAVTNIGVRPTFGPENMDIFVETHLLDADGDFYGKTAKLEFIKMLREEIRFNSAEELHEQIARDIREARRIL